MKFRELVSKAEKELQDKPARLELCSRLLDLFFVSDYWGVQTKYGNYVSNTHWKLPNISPAIIWLALDGKISIGPYSINKQTNLCKYFAIDFDVGGINNSNREELLTEIQPHVLSVYNEIQSHGLTPHLEFSGNKGYHIFVFFEEPLDANIAYELSRYFVRTWKPEPECYPKQRDLHNKTYGNLIRMPLCVNKKTGMRSRWLNEKFEPLPAQFDYTANQIYLNDRDSVLAVYEQAKKHRARLIKINTKFSGEAKGPFEIEITGPNQRDRKEYCFVMRCIENNIPLEKAKELGSKWLSQYQDMFETPLDLATMHLENTVDRLYRKSAVV